MRPRRSTFFACTDLSFFPSSWSFAAHSSRPCTNATSSTNWFPCQNGPLSSPFSYHLLIAFNSLFSISHLPDALALSHVYCSLKQNSVLFFLNYAQILALPSVHGKQHINTDCIEANGFEGSEENLDYKVKHDWLFKYSKHA